ncbi:MAG TPA: UDP-N-acetylmuramoyl-tripeptide--D-alanyl-D-alanine ligase, partial [Bacteroidota bacterium]
MKLALSEILSVPYARALGFEAAATGHITGVSTDSRSTQQGDAFFAIRGEKLDGHDFVTKAIGSGASVIVVDRKWADANGTMLVSISVPRLVVGNTTVALGDFAAAYRSKFRIPFIAIAGSNGKTTTKNMVSAVLATKYNVLSTEGNLNNQIGVPQTLFRLTEDHDLAVVEIGTNHFAEIEYLCRILAPTHGLITNIGHEHLEFFGSLQGVAKAEGELLEWLHSSRGTFFFNKDDSLIAGRLNKSRGTKTVSFGFAARNPDVKGAILATDENGCSRI